MTHICFPPYAVAMAHCPDYTPSLVDRAVGQCLDACGWQPASGCRVLVKPNLLRADSLTCTHPQVVRAACQWLLDHGAQLTVADSPGFGTVKHVARSIGLTEALKPLGLAPRALVHAVAVPLNGDAGADAAHGHWGVSSTALHSDVILSIPRIKAHCQMRLTLGTKNLFGCVCGWRKAVAHTVQGKNCSLFTASLVDLWAALPPVVGLADGITCMDVTGPSGGNPFTLGCVAASSSVIALDTAVYSLLQARPEQIPLWAELTRRRIAGATLADVTFPLASLADFDASGFRLPLFLTDTSFQPHRLLWSLCRRLRQHYFP